MLDRGLGVGRRVLVIGAGPSGVSAAYHLARLGHEVEIRDAGERPGGMMRYAIPAYRMPRDVLDGELDRIAALGVQTCFFAISSVLPRDEAIAKIKAAIAKTYGRRGAEVVARNHAAVDTTLEGLHQIEVPGRVTSARELPAMVPAHAPEFVRAVTAMMMAGRGDELPVSMLPVDGTYPSGTTAYEKRNISELVAEWDPDLCIQCGNCSFVCPHSVIRATYYDESLLEEAPPDFKSAPLDARGLPDTRFTLQVYVEDCTGCELCVQACPVGAPDNWMARKGYTSVADLRGLLAVPAGTDQAAYERAGYVRALRAANVAHGSW